MPSDPGSRCGPTSLRKWLPQVVEEIVTGFAPERVILFGSVARGEDTEDSDLDLMVVFGHLDAGDRIKVKAKLMAAITAPVAFDIFVTDIAEFEANKDVNGTRVYWPAHEGVVVHDRAVA